MRVLLMLALMVTVANAQTKVEYHKDYNFRLISAQTGRNVQVTQTTKNFEIWFTRDDVKVNEIDISAWISFWSLKLGGISYIVDGKDAYEIFVKWKLEDLQGLRLEYFHDPDNTGGVFIINLSPQLYKRPKTLISIEISQINVFGNDLFVRNNDHRPYGIKTSLALTHNLSKKLKIVALAGYQVGFDEDNIKHFSQDGESQRSTVSIGIQIE